MQAICYSDIRFPLAKLLSKVKVRFMSILLDINDSVFFHPYLECYNLLAKSLLETNVAFPLNSFLPIRSVRVVWLFFTFFKFQVPYNDPRFWLSRDLSDSWQEKCILFNRY